MPQNKRVKDKKDKAKKQRGGDDDYDGSDDEDSPLDPRILAAIRQVVKEEVSSRLTKLQTTIDSLKEIQTRVDNIEKSLQYTSDLLEETVKRTLPSLADHVAQLTEAMTMQTLNLDVHRRKWNMILHGIEGPENESESDTRAKCLRFATEVLKVDDGQSTHMSACHRLSRKQNAGIIIRFCDLSQRDRWLAGTRNLRGYPKKISLSPDMPPPLRKVKDDVMKKRRDLEPSLKSKSRVRYLPVWPYVELRVDNQQPIYSDVAKSSIVHDVLNMHPAFKIKPFRPPAPGAAASHAGGD